MQKKMNPTLKKWLLGIAFVMAAVAMVVLLSVFFNEKTPDMDALKDVKPYGLLAEPDDTIDVLIFGDSEAFSTFSPVQMWEEYGFSSYVVSSASQYISLTDSFVKQSLAHQKPKVVFLETNAIFRKMTADKPLESTLERIFPVFQYHNLWKNFDPANVNENEDDYFWNNALKGFKYISIVNPSKKKDYMKATGKRKPLPASNESYVESIINTCKKHGVEPVFVSAPSTVNWNYAKHNTVTDLAKKYGVKYIDLNLENAIGLDWSKDTCDRGDHVNYFGASKTTAYFGKYIKKNFELADRRNDPAYSEWNTLHEKYAEVTAGSKSKYKRTIIKGELYYGNFN